MILFEIILVSVVIYSVFFCKSRYSSDGFKFDKANTYTIRGIAMIMIMFHHCSQYMGSINRVGSYFKKYGFIFTGVFLFLSGYVSCYSLQIKAESKLDILKWFICRVKAIYKILIPSFLALLPIIIWVKNIEANFIYEMFYSLLTITLPVTRLWYIKVQVLLYGILALAFTVDQNKKVGMSLIIMDGLIVLAMRYYFMLPNIWWNTQLCFCVGVIYRLYQDIIDMYLEKNFIAWITICICLEWYFHDEIILAIISCLFVIAINKKGWRDRYVFCWIGQNSLYYFIFHVVIIQLSYNIITNDNILVLFAFIMTTLGVIVLKESMKVVQKYWLKGIKRLHLNNQ